MQTDFDTVVVGGGLFGQIIARALATRGQQVQIIDNHNPHRGSDPAACLMKPGWLSKLGKELQPSLELLNELYGVQDLTFETRPKLLKTTVHWVQPSRILAPEPHPNVHHSLGTVESVAPKAVWWRDSDQWEERTSTAQNVIVAGGIWSGRLLPWLHGRLDGRWGVASTARGSLSGDPFIQLWAPFKQIVCFQIDPLHVWCGDGSAWKDFPTDERVAASGLRERKALYANASIVEPPKTLLGARPYAKTSDPCLLEQHGGVWAATGGAKNGTAAAAWAARRLMEALL